MNRQTERRDLFELALYQVNQKHLEAHRDHLKQFTGRYRGMLRRARRNLAMAFATREWRTGRPERGIKPQARVSRVPEPA
jgi:hypothetical protein